MKAYLEIPTAGISSNTVFSKDGTITTTSSNPSFDIIKKNGEIVICGQSMKEVEDIQTVKPYPSSGYPLMLLETLPFV